MRVLTILNSLDVGGIEKTLLSCMKHFEHTEIKIDVCCFTRDGALEKEFLNYGVNIFYIKKTGSTIYDAIQLSKILNTHRYDIVHSRLSYTSAGFAIAAKMKGIPFYLSIHNEFASTMIGWKDKPGLNLLRKSYLLWHKKVTLRLSTLIIGHSKSNLDRNYKNWKGDKKFTIVYNGVDFEKLGNYKALRYDKFTIIHIGSFRYQKNHLFLLNCFHKLNPIVNNLQLILLGDGGLKPQVESRIAALGLSNNVQLPGTVHDIGKYLKNADLFLFPSLFEGLANVLMEAQYMGLPICASKINPHYESVYKEYHKYFFDPEDEAEALKQMKEVISLIKVNQIDTVKEEAKRFVESQFTVENMAKNLIGLYTK